MPRLLGEFRKQKSSRVPAPTSEFLTSEFGEQKTENSLPNSVQKSEITGDRIHQRSKIVYDCKIDRKGLLGECFRLKNEIYVKKWS